MKQGVEIQLVIIKGAENIVMMKTKCDQGSPNTPTWHIFWTWKTKDQILKAAQDRGENIWRCPELRDLERDVLQVWPSKGPSKKHLESWKLEAGEANGSQGGTEAAGAACSSSWPHNPRPNFMESFWGGLPMPAKYPLGEVQALLV